MMTHCLHITVLARNREGGALCVWGGSPSTDFLANLLLFPLDSRALHPEEKHWVSEDGETPGEQLTMPVPRLSLRQF